MVLVLGEAGIGKTRLVEAVAELAGATGGLVVQARCYEAERSLFQPVAEAVRAAALALPPGRVAAAAGDAAGTLAELVPDLRRLLDLPGYEQAPAALQRRQSFEAVAAFVRGLAAQQPLLLAVDDLHLASASTQELLHFLRRRLHGDRVLVLAGVRAEEGAEALAVLAGAGPVLELGPLPAAAVAELAAASAWPTWPGRCWSGPGPRPVHRGDLRAAAEEGPRPGRSPGVARDAVQTRARRAGPEVETCWGGGGGRGRAGTLEVMAGLLDLPVECAPGPSVPWPPACWSRTTPAPATVRQRPGPRGQQRASPRPTPVTAAAWPACWPTGRRRPPARRRRRRLGGRGQGLDGGGRQRRRVLRQPRRRTPARPGRGRRRPGRRPDPGGRRPAGPGPGPGRAGRLPGRLRRPGAGAGAGRRARPGPAGGGRPRAARLDRLLRPRPPGRLRPQPPGRELAERAVAAPGAGPTALLLAARALRHAEGDLAGARGGLRHRLAEPDPATQTAGLAYLGLLLEHGDRFAEARQVLDQAWRRAEAAGLFRPMLTSCFAATLAYANLGDLRGAGAAGRAGAHPGRRRGSLLPARAATAGSWLWRELAS